MSMKLNLSASALSQVFNALIGVALMPVYLRLMGAEAFGVVGFFIVLQSWFMLLDMGLSGTISRETARLAGGGLSGTTYLRMWRWVQGMFVLLGFFGGMAIWLGADWLASGWLQLEALLLDDVRTSLRLMSVAIALRWMAGLYRGVVIGAERIVWLSSFNMLFAAARFVGVLLSLALFGAYIEVFFWHQLVISGCELLLLYAFTHRIRSELVAVTPEPDRADASLRSLVGFAGSLALASSVWILSSQTDRLMLSGTLSLTHYGYFSLAAAAAGVLLLVNATVAQTLMPRLTNLHSSGDAVALRTTYRQVTQLVAIVVAVTSLTLALCSADVLQLWSGDSALAANAAPVLSIYALANGVLNLSSFPYYLQYAHGDLRYHVLATIGFAALLVPAIIGVVWLGYGALGTGAILLLGHLIYLCAWTPFVHRKFLDGYALDWLFRDVLVIVLPAAAAGLLLVMFLPPQTGTFGLVARLGLVASILTICAMACSSMVRDQLASIWRRHFAGTA